MASSQRGLQLNLWQEWPEHSNTSQQAHQLLLSSASLKIFLKSMIVQTELSHIIQRGSKMMGQGILFGPRAFSESQQ